MHAVLSSRNGEQYSFIQYNTIQVFLQFWFWNKSMLSKAIFLLFFLVLNQYGNCTRYYKTVLVFGGNGFLGSEAVANLKHETKGTLVTMVNRGTRYWDSETRIFSGRPPVTFVKCDRNDLGNCSELMKVLAENRLYDSVVDFTAYHPDNIQVSWYCLQVYWFHHLWKWDQPINLC